MEVIYIQPITNNFRGLSLKNDIVFKALFSKRGNEIFLKNFLSDLLNINISDITIEKDNFLSYNFINEKTGILDIKATLNESKIIDIEMQISNYHNIIKRGLFYGCKLITNQLTRRQNYSAIKDCIVIIIADFNIFDFDDYITETITVPKGHPDYEIYGLQKFYYIELPKFRKSKKNLNVITNQWLEFIDGEDKKGVDTVMSKNAVIKKANRELEYLTGEASIRRAAELREKYEFDWNSSMSWNFNDGMQKGIQKGIEKASIKIAKSMLKKGIDIDTISEITGLTIKEINKLK